MAKWMGCKGVGSRFSVLVLRAAAKPEAFARLAAVILVAVFLQSAGVGCSTSEDEPKSSERQSAVAEHASSEAEQVVQRMAPEPARAASSPIINRPTTSPADTRLSAAGVSRADSRPSSAGEPITSKHLEAELNRLEAELGN